MDFLEMRDNPFLWAAASVVVINALIQAVLFLRKSMKVASEIGITKKQINGAIRTSIITTIPPSIAMGLSLIALMGMVGKPIAWSRLSVIGALFYESMAAQLAANQMGLTFATMTPKGFVIIAFVMAGGTLIWQLMPMIFAPHYEKIYNKLAGGDLKAVQIISLGSIVGISVSLLYGYVNHRTFNTQPFWAGILGAIAYFIGSLIMKRLPKLGWLSEWVFTIAMFVGMFGALLF